MHLCQWDDGAVASPQPFALQMDHLDVVARVNRLEDLFSRLPAPILNSFSANYPQSTTAAEYKTKFFPATNIRRPAQAQTQSSSSGVNAAGGGRRQGSIDVEELMLSSALRSSPHPQSPMTVFRPATSPSLTSNPNVPVQKSTIFLPPDHEFEITDIDPLRSEAEQVDEILSSFWNVVPKREACNWLVLEYFRILHWYLKPMHKNTFLEEYEVFWNTMRDGRGREVEVLKNVDPLWLAMLCMILCLPLDAHVLWAKVPDIFGEQNPEEVKLYPKIWFNASQRLMRLGDYTGVPRIRAIQVILLYGPYLQNDRGVKRDGHRYLIWLSSGIRIGAVIYPTLLHNVLIPEIAQTLGLHDLGDDPHMMPPPDPAYPIGVNTLAREMAKRCWNCLVTLDHMQYSTSFMIDPRYFSTDLPINLDDDDLSPDSINTPKPVHTYTDATIDIFRSKIMRHLHHMQEVQAKDEFLGYETIVRLDKGFRDAIDTLPECMTIPNKELETKKPEVGWQRNLLNGAVNHRILRLHRPFMQRGYNEPLFAYSTKAALKCARVIVASHSEFRESPVRYLWFTHHQLLTALMTLYQDTFHMIDTGAPASEIEDQLRALDESLTNYKASGCPPSGSALPVVRRSADLLEHLAVAARRRMDAKADGKSVKSFQEVVRELAIDVQDRDEQNTRVNKSSSPSSSMGAVPRRISKQNDISQQSQFNTAGNSQQQLSEQNLALLQSLGLLPANQNPNNQTSSWSDIMGVPTPAIGAYQNGAQTANWNPFPMF
ncbi:hypothetical protein BT69DRAFT_1346231 [Atractiella rhizophila]|nr:hypothetical protein BT69DRAFT_1346231 [Atractiella rhizophila]